MQKIKTLLGRLITIIALYFVASFIIRNLNDVVFSFSHDFTFYLILSILTSSAFFFIRNFAWNKLIKQHAHTLPFVTSSWFLSSSEIIRYIPGNIWGLAARIVKAPKFGISRSMGFILLIEESVLLITSAGFISGVGLLLVPNLSSIFHLVGAALIISCILLLWIPFHFQNRFQSFRFLRNIQPSKMQPPKKLIRLLPLYLALWVLFGVSHFTLFYAIFPHTSILTIIFFSIISWLAGYASLITPSGLGIRELVFGLGLGTSVALGVANTFALIARIWYVVLELVWYGVLYLLQRQARDKLVRP